MKKNKIIISICLILITVSIVFSPSLKNDFTNWDDHVLVTENPKVKDLSWKNIRNIFGSRHVNLYHPLVLLTYSIEYHLFKLNPGIYHTTNLILHLLNCMLVFWLILILSRNVLSSFVVTILFGIHPLHVESVAWISERKDVLYAFFFLGTIISYLYYHKNKILKYYYLSLFMFILSLLSKPMAVTLPFVLLLCDYLVDQKFDRRTLRDKTFFFVISVLFGVITILINIKTGNIGQGQPFTFLRNVLNATHALVFYLVKMVLPIKLSCFYPLPNEMDGVLAKLFSFSPFIVMALSGIIFYSGKYTRKVVFGSLFFLITITPILQLIPVGRTLFADRHTYVPSIGLFYIVAEGFSWLYLKKVKCARIIKILVLIILIGITVIFSYLTWQRCKIWKDSITLWDNVIKNYPNVSTLPYSNRGKGYFDRGEYAKAIPDFSQALKINPKYADAYINRGISYTKEGKYNKAISDFNQALRINPNSEKAFINRGNVYSAKGEYDKAMANFNQALITNPNHADAWCSRGIFYATKGEYNKAMADFNQALITNPNHADAWYNRGIFYAAKGKYDRAISDYTQAVRINPGFVKPYNNRGDIYFKKGEYDKAIADYNIALKINPNYKEAYYNRGNTYYKKGEYDKAISDYNRAISIDPGFAKPYNNRGNIYLKKGEYDKAISDYNIALKINPDYKEAYYNRAISYLNKEEYDKAWKDVYKLKSLEYKINPGFLKELRKFSGRQQ